MITVKTKTIQKKKASASQTKTQKGRRNTQSIKGSRNRRFNTGPGLLISAIKEFIPKFKFYGHYIKDFKNYSRA